MNAPAGHAQNPEEPRAGQVTMHAVVSGRVQGVGFRFFVYREGRKLGLAGVVRNLPDGRVDVVAEGPEPTLHQLLGLLRRGPMLSRVDEVDVEWNVPPPRTSEFTIGF